MKSSPPARFRSHVAVSKSMKSDVPHNEALMAIIFSAGTLISKMFEINSDLSKTMLILTGTAIRNLISMPAQTARAA